MIMVAQPSLLTQKCYQVTDPGEAITCLAGGGIKLHYVRRHAPQLQSDELASFPMDGDIFGGCDSSNRCELATK